MRYSIAAVMFLVAASAARGEAPDAALAAEVRTKGWILYSARSPKGDWDLFACRPDGADVRNLTNTPETSEFYPLLSRDGGKLLFRRVGKAETIDGNRYGSQGELVLANADGSGAKALGADGELPWASWSPDGKQLSTLSLKGIQLVDLATLKVAKTIPRKGFYQQLTWSPDGSAFLGVSNDFGTSWASGRLMLGSGQANAVSAVDCCTPDWFPDGKRAVFSWRPPSDTPGKSHDWTQLWAADADGKNRQLLYAEDNRHIYGGHISPDGKYVIFTGNVQEDGDPQHAGSAMNLIRLADTPMVAGDAQIKRHPQAKRGPKLSLPAGYEPIWTARDIFAPATQPTTRSGARTATSKGTADALARELHEKGWIVFGQPTDRGDWDLAVSRPDGTDVRKVAGSADYHEAGGRFSPDGKHLLYYRIPRKEPLDNNNYGTYELVIANGDGSQPVVWGDGFPWASWGPDSAQIACLKPGGIEIIDVRTRAVKSKLPRHGMVEQLVWSPDGTAFTATSNGLGAYWNIGMLSAKSPAKLFAASETERYNCTSDWMPDSKRIVYARGIVPDVGGRAELYIAAADGSSRALVYAEESRHIYGACASPDGKYVIFTRSEGDLGKVGTITMAVIRLADGPMAVGESAEYRKRYPKAGAGPRLDLPAGWEPHWTAHDVFRK